MPDTETATPALLPLTHERLRKLYPENFGWVVLSFPLPDHYGLASHAFTPQSGWTICEPTELVLKTFAGLPMTTCVDPTDTIHLTVAEDEEGCMPALLQGDGWQIFNGDLQSDSWEALS